MDSNRIPRAARRILAGIVLALVAVPALAAEEAAGAAGGDTAWILTATALVLFMTLPGLALFYGGLVRSRAVLSVLMHCFAIACLVSVLWLAVGYSLAFGDGGAIQAWLGGFDRAFLAGVGTGTLSGSLPEIVFFMFQMTFAVITPALIVGAYVERVKFGAVLLFSGLWSLVVYAPVAHWIWGGGFLAAMGVQDFAGGLVVHLTCGVSALIFAAALGPRRGFPDQVRPPHAPSLVMIGAAMLWVGWYGFNGGSALTADGAAGMAIAVTHISAATAALVWMIIEWATFGRPTLVGIATGAIAGLATITPASGFVGPAGGLAIGAVAGLVCFAAVGVVKKRLRIDDSLDVLAVHGVGGATGTLLTAVFGAAAFGGLGLSEVSIGGQLWIQAVGVLVVLGWTAVATLAIVFGIKAVMGLRVDDDAELEGLDIASHGERAYDYT